jgi:hypothetical protein
VVIVAELKFENEMWINDKKVLAYHQILASLEAEVEEYWNLPVSAVVPVL